jgi:hypothetical protein
MLEGLTEPQKELMVADAVREEAMWDDAEWHF